MKSKQKPKLGQNFLVDTRAQQRIVDSLGPAATGTVVEIGPGHAALTELLAQRAKRLVAVELDRALAAELRFRFRERPAVEILEADVLKVDLSALAGNRPRRQQRTQPGRPRQPAVLHHLADSAAPVRA